MRTMKEKMHTEELYLPDDDEIVRQQTACLDLLYVQPNPSDVVAVGNPCRALRKIGDRDREYYFKNHRIDL